jgi:hypothetical protein
MSKCAKTMLKADKCCENGLKAEAHGSMQKPVKAHRVFIAIGRLFRCLRRLFLFLLKVQKSVARFEGWPWVGEGVGA